MEPAKRLEKRRRKGLTRFEKTVIYGLIILAGLNAELGITDRASLDAFEQNLETPQRFLWPLSLLIAAAGMGFLWSHLENTKLKTALSYAAMITLALGLVRFAELIIA